MFIQLIIQCSTLKDHPIPGKAFIKPLSMICRFVEILISSSDHKIGSNARCPYLFHFIPCNVCMQASWQEQHQHQVISKRKVYIKSSRKVSIHSFIKRQAIITAPGPPSTKMFLCPPRHQISAKSAPQKARNRDKAKLATELRKLRKDCVNVNDEE